MQTEDFAGFVARQRENAADANVDWAGIRDEWLRNLDALHQELITFLQEYISAGSISYSFSEITLSEENIGSYLAKRMDIRIGRQSVSLEPIGTLLIGCKGRVDALGSAGRVPLFLVNARAKSAADLIKVTVTVSTRGKVHPPPPPLPSDQPISWAWKIVTGTPRKFADLDKDSFTRLLMEVTNG